MSNSTMSPQLAEAAAYLSCVARSNRDPDMQGYAVRLSSALLSFAASSKTNLGSECSFHRERHVRCVAGLHGAFFC